MEREGEDDEIVCLDESFFINDNYQLTPFTFGSHVLELYCLQSASRQLVWPGAVLLNDYLSKNAETLQGSSVIELGSGVGITGMLCSRFCREVVLTDHNEEVLKILKKNIELQESSQNSLCCAELKAEKLEWGNSDQLNSILQRHSTEFDLVLGADICFQQSSVPLLFDTVEKILSVGRENKCKFILAYVSRAKVMDTLVISEAIRHGLQINEVTGTRAVVQNLEGVVFEITLA
ncbi:protein N-lysine methyltransferase METTL21A isoform X2 [Olea europaea var. sylvestris]|uniref:protein N-lysine methyltransferase METTL21A isoform X2 n=1 Tax=Olea europaea var. sylvestris TaxID=158386 RepID=UPI000C1D4CD8|nr:protein N-lysine methyltransferase METTL21A isoform X2 [Olea europaea var. sylvestris]